MRTQVFILDKYLVIDSMGTTTTLEKRINESKREFWSKLPPLVGGSRRRSLAAEWLLVGPNRTWLVGLQTVHATSEKRTLVWSVIVSIFFLRWPLLTACLTVLARVGIECGHRHHHHHHRLGRRSTSSSSPLGDDVEDAAEVTEDSERKELRPILLGLLLSSFFLEFDTNQPKVRIAVACGAWW